MIIPTASIAALAGDLLLADHGAPYRLEPFSLGVGVLIGGGHSGVSDMR